MTATPTITPASLGFNPLKFSTWRPGQWACINTTITTPQRFIGMAGPTGFGKSLYAVGCAVLAANRAMYITSTKSLQDQVADDFPMAASMRGRGNYSCVKGDDLTCSEGRVLGCRDSACEYQADRQTFLDRRLALTNYAYFFSSTIHSEGVGEYDMLILDEAHNAVEELSKALRIELPHRTFDVMYKWIGSHPPRTPNLTVSELRTWAKFAVPKSAAVLKEIKNNSNHRKYISVADAFHLTITRLADVPEDWIVDDTISGRIAVDPLWPTDYASSLLFRSTPYVILVSATLVPKTLSLLGIKEDEALFLSADHTFDPGRCPVYLFGACRVDHKTTESQWQETIGRMDTFIKARLDRKGIIHTTSYKFQERILNHSHYADLMIAPRNAKEFATCMEQFKKSTAPAIFVSPAATTGYDFPLDDCEYQILLKVPFLDTRSPVMAARTAADPEYAPYLTTQILVQTCGRAMRGPTDRCENLVLDRHLGWFLKPSDRGGYRHLFPGWFLKQVQWCDGQPTPAPKL